MTAKKIQAKLVCDILNENKDFEGFFNSIRGRVVASEDVAKNSDVACSVIDGGFDTSPLGFINALTDEPIALLMDKVDGELAGVKFGLVSDFEKLEDEEWDKYEKDLEKFSEDNGTNHKPKKRPER